MSSDGKVKPMSAAVDLYGTGRVQTRSDNFGGSRYAGCYYWQTVSEAFQAWKRDSSIFRIKWWEKDGKVAEWPTSETLATCEKKGWKHYCFIPVTKTEVLCSWSEASQRQMAQLYPRFHRLHKWTQLFVDQDLYHWMDVSTDLSTEMPTQHDTYHPIHSVWTEDDFVKRYCLEYLAKKRAREEAERKLADEYEEAERKRIEQVRLAAQQRRDAQEALRVQAEAQYVKSFDQHHGIIPSPATIQDAKKKRRGRRGGRNHKNRNKTVITVA